ncbi:MAG: hypothetical protein NTW96_17205, partial [Planctomycetia bacterium]|nr:hypothetical protein [Planctomycetia bacterium]
MSNDHPDDIRPVDLAPADTQPAAGVGAPRGADNPTGAPESDLSEYRLAKGSEVYGAEQLEHLSDLEHVRG